jgi:ATP-binding cassette, subfamily C (CFTR/MRP), member 1
MDSASKSPIFSHFSETLTGVSTIRAYGVQEQFIEKMQNNLNENITYVNAINYADRWVTMRLELIGNLITALASFFAVFSRNTLSPGLVGLTISYSLSV